MIFFLFILFYLFTFFFFAPLSPLYHHCSAINFAFQNVITVFFFQILIFESSTFNFL